MIFDFIGNEQIFFDGLKIYINKFAYKNANSEDFFAVMSEVSGKDFSRIFRPWITHPYYPEITIDRISQTKYQLTQSCSMEESDELLWPIPISYISAKKKVRKTILMETKQMQIEIPDLEQDDSIKFNYNLAGLYKTKYK